MEMAFICIAHGMLMDCVLSRVGAVSFTSALSEQGGAA
jgi:hypothetical protein